MGFSHPFGGNPIYGNPDIKISQNTTKLLIQFSWSASVPNQPNSNSDLHLFALAALLGQEGALLG